jgi:bromodomain and PHD finger-containing protein 1
MTEKSKNTVISVQDIGLQQFHLNEDGADDQDCSICRDGTVYVDNEIIFCEKCNVAVHQNCYGVEIIPDDEW